MVDMGRPKRSSYRSYQLIYARLLKGPLWLEDWKSTGLKSRSTVYGCLKYLASEGLVVRRRAGHRIHYEMTPTKSEVLTREDLLWHKLLYPISRKEKRRIKSQFRKHVKEIMEIEKERASFVNVIGKIWKEIDKIIEHPKSQEVYEALKEVGVDSEHVPIPNLLAFLLYPRLEDQLCIDCLRRDKEIIYYVTDPNTGEVICPKEGTVVREERYEIINLHEKDLHHYHTTTKIDI